MSPSERRRIYHSSCGLDPITPSQHKSAAVFAWAAIAMLVWCAAWLVVEGGRWVLDHTVFIP